MADRYEVRKVDKDTIVLIYTYGKYMEVQCNSSTGKTIVTNEISPKHAPVQFDEIFGLGEWQKFFKEKISETKTPNPNNIHSVKYCVVGKYLPKLAKKDIKAEKPEQDLVSKYFKKE